MWLRIHLLAINQERIPSIMTMHYSAYCGDMWDRLESCQRDMSLSR